MAKSDPSYTKTISYQKATSELGGNTSDSDSDRHTIGSSYTPAPGESPYEQIASGTGKIGTTHARIVQHGTYYSPAEIEHRMSSKVYTHKLLVLVEYTKYNSVVMNMLMTQQQANLVVILLKGI